MNRAAALAECRFCRQWEVASDDLYCSFCGSLLLPLEILFEAKPLITTISPTREITLRNDSSRPMQLSLRARSGGALAAGVTFDPGTDLEVAAKSEVLVHATADAAKLPPGVDGLVEYVCVVDRDERKQRTFTLEVRSGPSPKLLTPRLDFDEVAEGTAVERLLRLTNAGNVPLGIKSVRAEGSPHLRVEGDHANRAIRKGETLSIPVIWQSSSETPMTPAGEQPAGVRITFTTNRLDELFVAASARMFRYRLDVKPSSVRFTQALAKHEYVSPIKFENSGTVDVEITSIEPDQPWIHVIARATRFTLLCADSVARQKVLSPTTLRAFDFKIVCRPADLTPGRHRGNVTIRAHQQEPLVLPVEITIVKPKEYPDYIGIDFGTTNSVVAVLSQKDKSGLELVQDESSGKDLIPSVLVFDDPETYKIGAAALHEADAAPDRTVRSIKRVMGYERDRNFFDRPYSAAQLASLIIRKLVLLAERKLQAESTNGTHFTVRKAIITVPANFHDLQIRDVLEACDAAGLDTEEERAQKVAERQGAQIGEAVNAGIILDEPSAAVLYYIDQLRHSRGATEMAKAIGREQGLKLLVFDYGGGTLDVAVAGVTQVNGGGTGLRILANMGDNAIGGDQIDVLVMSELLRRCKHELRDFEFDTSLITGTFRDFQRRSEAEGWNGHVWRELMGVRAQWKDLAEKAKIQISGKSQPAIDVRPDLIVRLAGGAIERAPRGARIPPLASELVSELLQPVLARSEELIKQALALAEVGANDIDYILHTGRQSLLPHVRQRVRALFPNLDDKHDLLEEQHLKICVAKGAALYGSMRDRLVAPEARIVLLSEGRRLPHSYGVEKFTNMVEPEFDEVIERGAKYPVERTKLYPADMIPVSGYLNLNFYQNTGVSKTIVGNRQVSRIGQISIDTAHDGNSGCQVTFAVGPNRTLHVSANGNPVTIEPARLHEEESWMG
ncbi:MAG: hypothetical protein DMF56_19370 [Acidobacteria bacterium]|nr:MAG: hypothetical protein DMF56_19370 [Acidobacteriota bacterium]